MKFKQAIQLESVLTLVRYLEGRFSIQLVYLDGDKYIPLTRETCQEWTPLQLDLNNEVSVLSSPEFRPKNADLAEIKALLGEIEKLISEYISENSGNDPDGFGEIIGRSVVMQALFDRAKNVAATTSTVLLRGENGVGKDLLAQEIHDSGPRKYKPFLAQNCAAIPAELIESEFFGHKKGAFSGAFKDRPGLFETANGGTLFLDEIGDMPLAMQTKLLRVVESGSFMPVGGDDVRSVDVRLIFATHRDLGEMVNKGTFREDLYYRIKVIELTIPPLREREGDVEVLSQHFLRKFGRRGYRKKAISEDALRFLATRKWPGNVRQLDNEIERALIFSGEVDELEIEHFSELPTHRTTASLNLKSTMPEQVEVLEKALILLALKKHGWNKTQAAKTLGISRRNLIRKVAKFELEAKT